MRQTLATLALIAFAACGAPAADAAANAPDETDTIMLASAAAACEAEDYKAFFDAMISSPAVQRKYSAATIEFGRFDATRTPYAAIEEKKIAVRNYGVFPIRIVDHYRQAVVPARAGDKDEHVVLEFNQSQSNQISVEWTRVHYDGASAGGDDLGTAIGLDGQPYESGGRTDGQLLLYPTATCWELVADNRYERR